MKIIVYSPHVQMMLQSKTEPAPYFHFGVDKNGNWSIWVWDSREVIESGTTTVQNDIKGKPVHDNKEPLKGETKLTFLDLDEKKSLEIVMTDKVAGHFTKELNNNGVKFKKLRSTTFIVEDTPKVKMAIRMAKERFGTNCMTIKSL